MNLIAKALDFAYNAHKGQTRKDGRTPYIVHPIEVMRLLQECGCTDEEQLATALLHDTMEDCGVPYKELESLFGITVATRVERLTKPVSVDKATYMKNLAKHGCDNVIMVKAADRICNVEDFHDSGDIKYALKYLEKAASIVEALEKISQKNPIANALMWEMVALNDILLGIQK